MKAERDIAPLRVVQRVKDLDPGIDQGRNHRNPQRDRDIAAMVAGALLAVSMAVAAGVALVELFKWAAK